MSDAERAAIVLSLVGAVAALLGPLLGRNDICTPGRAKLVTGAGVAVLVMVGAWALGLVRVDPEHIKARVLNTAQTPAASPVPTVDLSRIKTGRNSPLGIPPSVFQKLELAFNRTDVANNETKTLLRELRGRVLVDNIWQKGQFVAPGVSVLEDPHGFNGIITVQDTRYGFDNEKNAEKYVNLILSLTDITVEEKVDLGDAPIIGDFSEAAMVRSKEQGADSYSIIFRTGQVVGVVEATGDYSTMNKREVYNLFKAAGDQTTKVLRRPATRTR